MSQVNQLVKLTVNSNTGADKIHQNKHYDSWSVLIDKEREHRVFVKEHGDLKH